MTEQLSFSLPEPRVVARVSCGVASVVAWKLARARYGDRVRAVERWLGQEVTVLRDDRYDANPVKVWIDHRFIASRHGAPCSKALKAEVLDTYDRPGDLMVLGYTAEESDRLDRFVDANANKRVIAPLIEEGLTKRDCLQYVVDAGLTLPLPYLQGFDNSNCLKCPKGGLGYWKHVDRYYPESYEEVARIQDLLGPGSWFLSDRRGGGRVRLSLRMLREIDEPRWRIQDEPPISCGGLCEWPDSEAA